MPTLSLCLITDFIVHHRWGCLLKVYKRLLELDGTFYRLDDFLVTKPTCTSELFFQVHSIWVESTEGIKWVKWHMFSQNYVPIKPLVIYFRPLCANWTIAILFLLGLPNFTASAASPVSAECGSPYDLCGLTQRYDHITLVLDILHYQFKRGSCSRRQYCVKCHYNAAPHYCCLHSRSSAPAIGVISYITGATNQHIYRVAQKSMLYTLLDISTN